MHTLDGPSFERFQEDVEGTETQLGVDLTVLNAAATGCAEAHYVGYAENETLNLDGWELRQDSKPETAVPGDVYQSGGQYLIIDEGLVVYSEGDCGFTAARSYLYPMETALGYSRTNTPEIVPQTWEYSTADWKIEAISTSVRTHRRPPTFLVELSVAKLSDDDVRVPAFFNECGTSLRSAAFDQRDLGSPLENGTVLRGVLSPSDYNCGLGGAIYVKTTVDAESIPVEIVYE